MEGGLVMSLTPPFRPLLSALTGGPSFELIDFCGDREREMSIDFRECVTKIRVISPQMVKTSDPMIQSYMVV